MYTDEDLNYAVKKGVFTDAAVTEFRSLLAEEKHTRFEDEENFRLVGGFNDIFVVIACSLLLFSSVWVVRPVSNTLAMLVFAALSWGLAELFVRKRKMALPAIALLLSFMGGVFWCAFSISSVIPSFSVQASSLIAAAITTVCAYFHWRRFRVPITVAMGVGSLFVFFLSLLLVIFPAAQEGLMTVLFLCGITAFVLAMCWDASDTKRITRRSDVAFWLHLLSAPLIIHPIFSNLGILNGNESILSMLVVVFLYLLMTSISIAVDRRAFMVSSLIYVIYAVSAIIESYGGIGYSFALTGVLIGGGLLLLSAKWHFMRAKLLQVLPSSIQSYLPKVR
ncbi:hypothetical protein [Marinomonas pollencensis]|uniref:Membrane protein DUF2157 n=1 Tax=Marinomonas pollencensis TaxID=491954 RepID=A0A3E0DHX4_9GAMM|nr:hypothetical protein [Marinomonas pollencensis]REG82205.1 hypothetical protein DFP81_11093 [Marinomonas pollencensis]